MHSRTKKAIAALTRETRRLDKVYTDQSKQRLARTNARRNVLAAIRRLRLAVDDEYPVARKERKMAPRHKKKTATGRADVIAKKLDLVPCDQSTMRFAQLQRAGVKIHWLTVSAEESGGATYDYLAPYAPRWAVEAPADTTISVLRKARRSEMERRALRTLAACVKP